MTYNCNQIIMVDSKKHIVTLQKTNGHKMSFGVNRVDILNITSLDNLLIGIIILAIISIINLVVILG